MEHFMRAAVAVRAGGPEVFEIEERAVPQPSAGQLLVRHEAIGVNFVDLHQRSGGGLVPVAFPTVLGQEAAGVVEAVGDKDGRFRIGDRVVYFAPASAYAEFGLAANTRAVRLPAGISAEIAAASFVKGITAEFLVRRCFTVAPGQMALVYAAAGGVGSLLCQWAKALGATVIGVVGQSAKAEYCYEHGCDHVVGNNEDIIARVRELTGGFGVHVAYDSIGKETFDLTLKCLARRGMFVSYGNTSGPIPAFSPARLIPGSLYFTRPLLFDYVATPEELAASAASLFGMMETGSVRPEVGQRFALSEVGAAHAAIESRLTKGATVLVP
jgi:NADPH2:quinone reductase